jgi:hypothetical protein
MIPTATLNIKMLSAALSAQCQPCNIYVYIYLLPFRMYPSLRHTDEPICYRKHKTTVRTRNQRGFWIHNCINCRKTVSRFGMCTIYRRAKECKLGRTDQLFLTRSHPDSRKKLGLRVQSQRFELATLVGHKRPSKEQLTVATYLKETSLIRGNIYP